LTLKEHFKKRLSEQDAIQVALRALVNAAEEDVGTGGPDLFRRIYPTMKLVDHQGVRDVEESVIAALCEPLMNRHQDE
ncbi:MAG: proteasome subunit beta, partial [Nitrospira sp.]|nr:proteasome subunit beta [Nitrospira sp.]